MLSVSMSVSLGPRRPSPAIVAIMFVVGADQGTIGFEMLPVLLVNVTGGTPGLMTSGKIVFGTDHLALEVSG